MMSACKPGTAADANGFFLELLPRVRVLPVLTVQSVEEALQ